MQGSENAVDGDFLAGLAYFHFKMKDSLNVCRVCSSQDQVLLDLFGSDAKSVSYVEDLNKCLSVEVSEGDQLPSKICIKCVGRISECRPFVDKILALNEKEGRRKSISDDNCYICLSSENYLFPVPEDSISKSRDCFEIVLQPTNKICHKCQFHLETLHELKSKACSTLKQFYSDSLSVKPRGRPKRRESVTDLVNDLKSKYTMNLPETKNVLVKVVDVGLIIGSDFFSKGTVSVKEFWEKLCHTGKENGETQKGRKKLPLTSPLKDSSLKEPQSVRKAKSVGNKSKKATKDVHVDDISSSTESTLKVTDSKRLRELSESDEDTPLKRLKVNVKSGEEEEEKGIKVLEASKQRRNSHTSDDLNRRTNTEKVLPNKKTPDSPAEELVSSKRRSKVREVIVQSEALSTVPDSTDDAIAPGETEDSVEPDKNEAIEESEGQKKKRKRGSPDTSHADVSKNHIGKVEPQIKRKRKTSEDENFSGFKNKIRRKRWEPTSDEDSGLDEPTASVGGDTPVAEEPSYLRELNEMLRLTPKTSFKPFICSVCHEGYISTVKGKLHKLIIHDPHSNMVLKIKRCEDDAEMKKLIEISLLRSEKHSACNTELEEGKSDIASEGRKADSLEENENEVTSKSKRVQDGNDSDDDMFVMKGINTADASNAFDKLFSDTSDGNGSGKGEAEIAAEKTNDALEEEKPNNTVDDGNCGDANEPENSNEVDDGKIIDQNRTETIEENNGKLKTDASNAMSQEGDERKDETSSELQAASCPSGQDTEGEVKHSNEQQSELKIIQEKDDAEPALVELGEDIERGEEEKGLVEDNQKNAVEDDQENVVEEEQDLTKTSVQEEEGKNTEKDDQETVKNNEVESEGENDEKDDEMAPKSEQKHEEGTVEEEDQQKVKNDEHVERENVEKGDQQTVENSEQDLDGENVPTRDSELEREAVEEDNAETVMNSQPEHEREAVEEDDGEAVQNSEQEDEKDDHATIDSSSKVEESEGREEVVELSGKEVEKDASPDTHELGDNVHGVKDKTSSLVENLSSEKLDSQESPDTPGNPEDQNKNKESEADIESNGSPDDHASRLDEC